MKTRQPPKLETRAAPGDGRARFAADLLGELAAPAGAPQTWLSGSYHDADSSDWLDGAGEAAVQARAELAALAGRVGSTIGPYRLTSLLGRGGMGAVFAAERVDGEFAQRVALKLIIGGGSRLASRFRRERAILARLDHPHIAHLLDGGLSAAGEPWFAMELVDGESLTGYCEARRLGVRARLALFLQICDAVAYAHRHLIVHRDLKPPNVLVTADGDAKLLDFGIAKLVDRGRTETELTRADERVLTPDYAAPEQILGEPVTTATDVYALGLVLYEMLTGERAQPLGGKSALEAERWIVNREIGRPSAVPCMHARALRGDLDAIVGKALRKEPEHRYASAQALADDLRRHLDGHAIHARVGGWSYRTVKFARRNRLAVGVFAALLAGFVTASWQAHEAQLQADRAQSVKRFVIGIFGSVDPRGRQGGAELTARELTDAGVARLRTQLQDQPEDRAELLLTLQDLHLALGDDRNALKLAEEALALARTIYPPGDVRLLPALSRTLQGHVTRADSAQALADEADALLVRAGSTYDEDRLRVLATHLLRKNREGDFKASERAARDIIALQERRFGPESSALGEGLIALGWAYSWQNRYDEAEAIFRRALALGPLDRSADGHTMSRTDPETIYTHLARIETYRGRYAAAQVHFLKSLELVETRLGKSHPFVATLDQSIAFNEFHLGRAEHAENALREHARLAADGPAGERARFVYWMLGRVLLGRGKLPEAIPALRLAIEQTSTAHGAGSKLTQLVARDLGAALAESGAHGEAEVVLAAALAALDRIETTASHQYALVETRLVRLLLARGDAALALPRAVHAYDVLRRESGEAYDETMRARHELGRALVVLGRSDEGIAHLRSAAAGYESLFGIEDVRTAEYRFALGEALLATAPREARALLDTAARALVAVDGNVLPVRARAERWLREKAL